METNYISKRLKLIWPVFALLMLSSFFVNAQEKGQTLRLTIECEGVVVVKDANTAEAVATIEGPVTNSQIPVSSNQVIDFVTTGHNDDNCLTVIRWEDGAEEVLGTDPDLFGVVMKDDNLYITAYFGAPVQDPYSIEEIDDVQTISGTPIIVPVNITYGTVSPTTATPTVCDFTDWVVDSRVSITTIGGAPVVPTDGMFLEIMYDGVPIIIDDPDILSSAFYMSDVLGVTPADLFPGHQYPNEGNWTFTLYAKPTFTAMITAVAYKVNIDFITWDDDEGCETILASEDFTVTYRPAKFTAEGEADCDTDLCFDVTLEHPVILNIGEKEQGIDDVYDILWNMWIEGPFTSGQTLTVEGHGLDASWTLPGNIDLSGFYLSQVLENSVSPETEYNEEWDLKHMSAGKIELTICVGEVPFGETTFALTALAQLGIATFDADDDFDEYVLKDFPYATTTATLERYPDIAVEYQKQTGGAWSTEQTDKVCGRDYELNARVKVTPDDAAVLVPAGRWITTSVPSGAFVTFDDATEPNTDVHVSSFGVYTFQWQIVMPGIPSDCIELGYFTIGFYPEVASSLAIEPEDAEVCSLATVFTMTKNIVVPTGVSNSMPATNWTLPDYWVVQKYTYNHAAAGTAADPKWAWRDVSTIDASYNPLTYITLLGTTAHATGERTYRFDAANTVNPFGEYRVIYNTAMSASVPPETADLCVSTKDTINIKLYWKPRAEILDVVLDPCERGLAATVPPVEIKANDPRRDYYPPAVINPFADGRGQWTYTKPDGATVAFVTGFADLTKREIKFRVDKPGTYEFTWTVSNGGDREIPCDNPVSVTQTIIFPEDPVATVNNEEVIYCFSQVEWEPYMDVITGATAYVNPFFTGAANTAGRIRIYENWVTNYHGNMVQLDAEKYPDYATGWWTAYNQYGVDVTGSAVQFLLPATEGGTIDPRVATTFTFTGARAAGDAVALFLYPGKYTLEWEVSTVCDDETDSFDVEFLPSPPALKIMEVTEGGQVVPPRPVCVGDEVHYILRRTDGSEPAMWDLFAEDKVDVFWTIPENFEVLAQGGGGGINQYWIKGVWTDELFGANFTVEEVLHVLWGCETVNEFDPVQYKPSLDPVTISGPTTVAAGIAYDYSVEAQTGANYKWTVVGGTISNPNVREVEVVWSATATTRTLEVVVSGAFCNSPQTDKITVSVEAGKLAGQLRYWNAEETFMPSPFATVFAGGQALPDYFYVELWSVDADGAPDVMIERVAVESQVGGDAFRSYFEFEDIDLTQTYVLRVFDGGYWMEQGIDVADAQLAYTYTWRSWGGATATDALAIQLMVAGEELNAAPYNWVWVGDEADDYGFFSFETADVNSSGTLELVDALTLLYRTVGINAQFPNNTPNFRVAGRMVDALGAAGTTWPEPFDADEDLVFAKQEAVYQGTSQANAHGYISEPIPFTGGAQRYVNIYYVATGDVNSSYVPPASGLKEEAASDISLEYTGTITAEAGDIVEIPVRLDEAADLGAVTIGLTYDNSQIEVLDVNYSISNIENEEGWLRVASIEPRYVGANQAVLIVTARVLDQLSNAELFTLQGITEFADRNANILDVSLNTDAVTTDAPVGIFDPEVAELQIGNYPNPFTSSTTIEYTLPESGQVTLVVYNRVGQVVNTLVNEVQQAGINTVEVNSFDLGSGDGMFIYRITVEGQTKTYTATGNMVLMK